MGICAAFKLSESTMNDALPLVYIFRWRDSRLLPARYLNIYYRAVMTRDVSEDDTRLALLGLN